MFIPQKSELIDQNFIRRKQVPQERIEIEECQLKFQDAGDKLLKRVNDFNTLEKDITINLKKNTQQLIEDHQIHIIQLEEKVQHLKNLYIEQIEIIQKRIRMLAESQYKVYDNNISKNLFQEPNTIQQSTRISKDQNDRELQYQLENAIELINSFLPLKETTLVYECQQSVQRIIHNLALLQINDKKDEKEELKINLVCQEHQDQIIFIDLISRTTQSNRLGCQICANLNPQTQYQSIQQVQIQWKKVHQQKMDKMQINYVALMNKIFYIQEFFQLIKTKTFKSLEQASIKFDSSYYNYTQAILDLNKKMQNPWQNMSKEELETLALQINYLDVYQDPYTSEDYIINSLTKETLRNLQEYLLIYTNKLIPLIQNFANLKQENQEFQKNEQKLCNNNSVSEYLPNLNQHTQKNNQSVFGLTNTKQQDWRKQQNLEVETTQIDQKKLIYELKQEASIIQSEPCHAIDINKDIQILAASCGKTIKMFEFRLGFLKLVQILTEHTNFVFCLSFMTLSNQLISCGMNQIILWAINQSNLWECQQKLEGHVSLIRCVLINKTDDLIISGSDDMTIKFWYKQYQWSNQQTINDHSKRVLALSINEQQIKLISCSDDKSILIIESLDQDRKWIVKQKLVVEQYGLRLCFINNDLFAYQPNNSEQMQIYEIKNENILKKTEINLKNSQDIYSLFPQQYIKSKCLLFNKNGFYIHIIRQKENNQFIVEQSINFGTQNLYGVASEDGQYLITWDSYSKSIQVRTNIEK